MKRNSAFKLILSGVAAAVTAISLTSATYAFVIIGNNVYVEKFNFNIEGQEGLTISLDGMNYSQDITADMIKEKIAGSVESFDKSELHAVTIKQSEEKNSEGKYLASYSDAGNLNFIRDAIDYDTYTHKSDAAKAISASNDDADYISFDLYFKTLSSTGAAATNMKLAWGSKTAINAEKDNVVVKSSFTVLKEDGSKNLYTSGDKIEENVANAMRIATVVNNNLTVYENPDDADLGSAAITGRTDAKHDPKQSVMINYYNSFFPLYPFEKDGVVYGADDSVVFDTVTFKDEVNSTENVWVGNELGSFDENGELQMTVYIWLEGWDADYLVGTTAKASELSIDLEFVMGSGN